jgi:hypothetical protein
MPMNDDYFPQPPPRLSDEAAVEILDFLHHFVEAFENAYADQIRRHYQDLASVRPRDPPDTAATESDDPPF